MAQYRQSGTERFVVRTNHDLNPNHHSENGLSSSDHVSIGIRAAGGVVQHVKNGRGRRSTRPDRSLRVSIGSIVVLLVLVLGATVLTYFYISGYSSSKDMNNYPAEDDSIDFLTNVTRMETIKVLKFGHGSISHGRDSRYWDKDDRRRDDDYNEDALEHATLASEEDSLSKDHIASKLKKEKDESSIPGQLKGSRRKGVGLYNEAGRMELKKYEAEYEASLEKGGHSTDEYDDSDHLSNEESSEEHHEVMGSDVEYDEALVSHDVQTELSNDSEPDIDEKLNVAKFHTVKSSNFVDGRIKDHNLAKEAELSRESSFDSLDFDNFDANSQHVSVTGSHPAKPLRSNLKRKSKRHKFSSSSCGMKFLNSTGQLVEPLESRKFARFSLQYTEMEVKPDTDEYWKPRFAGHQTLQEREESFLAHDQKINCGFVNGPNELESTGFDLAEDDKNYISRCHIAVSSCIFGNSDRLRIPAGKTVSRLSKKNVCFVMFIDESTLQTLSSEGHSPDRAGFIGLWKIIVVKNHPYADMRRVGKVPKLLAHRLFPSARYSIWLDSKLRLQLDPLLILDYFLWRKGHEYAISNHYDRHCVWDEVAQNKKLNKYNHTVIDQQFAFYQADGLTRFNASDPNKFLPSNVPEGSFIVRAHTPMSNLFSCLWFNEVDRFTPRDQLSFAYTYQKLRRTNPTKPFYLNMFKDCERRTIAKLFRHRSDEQRNTHHLATE